MREFKILVLLIVVIGAIYYGVEPYAHSVMHPKVAPADFAFKDLEPMDLKNGDVNKGKQLVAENCTACHGIKSQNIPAPISESSSFGVVPPDLSHIAGVLDLNFLAHFIKDPVKTAKLSHKFNDEKPYPMPAFSQFSDKDLSDIVAYLTSILPEKLSDKEVFAQSCQRCHSLDYAKDKAFSNTKDLVHYLGSEVPDLSMMIRAKGEHGLNVFINDPQKLLQGTAMPRVGLSEKAQKQVITYLEKAGDRKKDERNSLGIKIMAFFAILAFLAYAWKKKVWSEVH
ncbi:c-type cytochrome [Helicobacter cetorum]|uniref:Ubiquinol cytochrome c oxidoreductase, cytochrome c1 subunit n=1 Tax=Helicobacter cetorum (strain ATCC BAA-429 / MIT 00-7128) TaxID=182217 RepID=I0EKC3_HELC0|nr:cytochrome c1 [Helicobacter cetorum]AFI03392.1 ubiquinol cytochrome c oxidoreductase, cytochrome c1 subunit [Helicobacter cetorum MIT 00-7128]